jgi:hypothetical protein
MITTDADAGRGAIGLGMLRVIAARLAARAAFDYDRA